MKMRQVEELLLQSLEHEMCGVTIFTTAVECAVNPALEEEWVKYLDETKTHVIRLEFVCRSVGIDPRKQTPGRVVVRHLGTALVQAMNMALDADDPEAAELVACECVVQAEVKDRLNWELIGKCAEVLDSPFAKVLKAAYDEIEDQEDEHLDHTRGWCRELWIQALGMHAVLPPLEEVKNVRTAMGGARAERSANLLR
jgi:hypothetical protein